MKTLSLKELNQLKSSFNAARQSNVTVQQTYRETKVKSKSLLSWVLDFLTK